MERLRFLDFVQQNTWKGIGESIDAYSIEDPHRDQLQIADPPVRPLPLVDTSIGPSLPSNPPTLDAFGDISDEILSDYMMDKLRGIVPVEQVIFDLDTEPNYTRFLQNTALNVLKSEREFRIDSLPDDPEA